MNWEKFRQMRLTEKIQWILQYYGVAIGVAIVAIFVAVVFITSIFETDEYALRVLILDDRQTAEQCGEFSRELSAMLSGECDVTSYRGDSEEQMQAFVVRLMTDALDLVIAPEAEMAQLAENGYLRSSAVLGEESFYEIQMGGGSGQYCIGETARSRSAERAALAIDYFMKQMDDGR